MRPLTSVLEQAELAARCSARKVAAEVCLETVKGVRLKWTSWNLQSVLSFHCPSRMNSRHLNSTTATWSIQLSFRLENKGQPGGHGHFSRWADTNFNVLFTWVLFFLNWYNGFAFPCPHNAPVLHNKDCKVNSCCDLDLRCDISKFFSVVNYMHVE